MRKLITRGPKIGTCNICGAHGPLTEDHTPPKGSVRATQVEMHHIANILSAEKPGVHGRVSQNGVKFRTLCGSCNSSLLGANYDVAFNDFSQKVASYLKTTVALPNTMYVRGKPQKIIRSLLGHLSALGIDRYKKGAHTEVIRDYFLDQSQALPNCMDIYYWIYPYRIQVLVRDAVLRNLKVQETAYIWLMKFFPLAFLIVWDHPNGYDYPQFPNLAHWGRLGIEDEVELPIQLSVVPHERWPEAPEEHSFLIYGEGAMGVHERPTRKNRQLTNLSN